MLQRMGNSYFQFKQFTVHQQGSAMKVCTDACVQGAFTATHTRNAVRVLDIGAGTGLLSLMLAQENNAQTDAVELEAAAADQAQQNFDASPWKERLQLVRGDVRDYDPGFKYDFIIANPPFYEQDLKSPDAQRNAAMHATTLSYEALLQAIDRLLTEDGKFSVLLPYEGFQRFRQMASGFVPEELLEIRQSVNTGFFRAVGVFARHSTSLKQHELSIHDASRQYTPEFIQLLRPYYLYL